MRSRTDCSGSVSCVVCNHTIYLLETCLLESCVSLQRAEHKVAGMDLHFVEHSCAIYSVLELW